MANDKTDFAGVAGATTAIAIAKGAKVKAVASFYQDGGSGIATKPDIKTPADMKGKTFAGPVFDFTTILLPTFEQHATTSGIKVQSVDPAAIPAVLKSGRTDMMTAAGWAEVPELKADGVKFNYFPYSKYGVNTVGPSITVNDNYLKKNPKTVAAFVKATAQGFAYAYKNPQDAAKIIKQVWPTTNAIQPPGREVAGDIRAYPQQQEQRSRLHVRQGLEADDQAARPVEADLQEHRFEPGLPERSARESRTPRDVFWTGTHGCRPEDRKPTMRFVLIQEADGPGGTPGPSATPRWSSRPRPAEAAGSRATRSPSSTSTATSRRSRARGLHGLDRRPGPARSACAAGQFVLLSFNHPLRVAERVATLDRVSDGRFELGTARSNNPGTLAAFQVDPGATRGMWSESIAIIRGALTLDPFSHDGELWQIPELSLVPRPVQTPHPPIHVSATSIETHRNAGRLGLGMMTGNSLPGGWDYLRNAVAAYEEELPGADGGPGNQITNCRGALAAVAHCAETTEAAHAEAAAVADNFITMVAWLVLTSSRRRRPPTRRWPA